MPQQVRDQQRWRLLVVTSISQTRNSQHYHDITPSKADTACRSFHLDQSVRLMPRCRVCVRSEGPTTGRAQPIGTGAGRHADRRRDDEQHSA